MNLCVCLDWDDAIAYCIEDGYSNSLSISWCLPPIYYPHTALTRCQMTALQTHSTTHHSATRSIVPFPRYMRCLLPTSLSASQSFYPDSHSSMPGYTTMALVFASRKIDIFCITRVLYCLHSLVCFLFSHPYIKFCLA